MEIKDRIKSNITGKTYTVTWKSDTVTQAEVGFAKTDTEGEVYFIKCLLSMKYPLDDAPGSKALKEARRAECEKQYKKNFANYAAIQKGCGEEGACVPILDYFREGAFYYTVYRKINADSLSLSQIASLSENDKLKLLLRLVQGLQPMHTLGIIHGDLKPENILVQRDKDSWRIRLIDINDCYHVGEPNDPGQVIGTADYYSPELTTYNTYEVEDWEDETELKHIKAMAECLTTKSDIFALGIIFHEFFTGERPKISDPSIKEIHEAAKAGKIVLSETIPAKIKALISSMLDADFNARPSLRQVGDRVRTCIVGGHVTDPRFSVVHIKDDIYKVTIENDNPDAIVYYTTDGTEPTVSSAKYTDSLDLKKFTTVKAICISDKRKSNIVSQLAWVKTAPMIVSKSPKIIVKGRNVEITKDERSPEATKIYYTTDGSQPSDKSNLYSTSFIVDPTATLISAIAFEPGMNAKPSLTVTAKVYKTKAIAPEIKKEFMKNSFCIISTEENPIYYTLDGSEPCETSIKYVEPFSVVDINDFQIKAICIDSAGSKSEIKELSKSKSSVMRKFNAK